MATNPQFPQHSHRDEHSRLDLVKGGTKGRSLWPLLIIAVAAALIVAIVVWMPRAPRPAVPPSSAAVPPQPTGNQVQLSSLQISPATTGGAANLTGTVFNAGNTSITAIIAEATFPGTKGQVAGRVTGPFLGVSKDGSTQPFLDNPIKPGERRPFRMQIAQVPQGWNNSMPAIALTQVAAEGNAGGSAGARKSR